MNIRLEKTLSVMISVAVTCSAFLPGFWPTSAGTAFAQSTGSLAIAGDVTGWTADESAGKLYVVTDLDKLHIISMDDMQIAVTKDIGPTPSDIELAEGKLYIPLSGGNRISVVDAVYGDPVTEIPTSKSPYRTAIDGNTLYYVVQSNSDYINKVDITTKSESKLNSTDTYYMPDIAVDPSTHYVYVGESGLSPSSKAAYYDGNVKKSQTSYIGYDGFPSAKRVILLDGNDVFFSGRKLDKTDLNTIYGDVVQTNDYGEIVYVRGTYLFAKEIYDSKTYIFDRDTFVKVGELPFEASYVFMDAGGTVYAYNDDTGAIEKLQPIIAPPKADAYTLDDNRIVITDTVTDMEFSDADDTLLATRKESSRLLYIDGANHTVNGELYIGSRPNEIEIYNGKAYVSLRGANSVSVTDAAYEAALSNGIATIRTAVNPGNIAIIGDNHLLYTDPDQWSYLYETKPDGTSGRAAYSNLPNTQTFYSGAVKFDSDMLLVGEKGSSGSDLYFFSRDTVTGTLTNHGSPALIQNIQYPEFDFVKDGSSLYYGDKKYEVTGTPGSPAVTPGVRYYDKTNDYYPEVLAAQGEYVITQKNVYKNVTNTDGSESAVAQFRLPFEANLAEFAADGKVYLYSEEKQGIFRYNNIEEIKIPRAKAQNPVFKDTNLSAGKISGTLTFNAAADQSYITGYNVFFVDGNSQKIGGAVGTISQLSYGTYSFGLTDVDVPSQATGIAVISYNEYAESMHAVKAELLDVFADGTFDDTDGEAGIVSGTLQWTPGVTSDEAQFAVYTADTAYGNRRLVAETAEPQAVLNQTALPAEAEYFVVMSKDSNGSPLNTTRIIPISDVMAGSPLGTVTTGNLLAPSGAAFTDTDADGQQIGGAVKWTKASSETGIDGYKVFFLDANNVKLGIAGKTSKRLSGDYRFVLPDNTAYPKDTVKLGVFAYHNDTVGLSGSVTALTDLGLGADTTPIPGPTPSDPTPPGPTEPSPGGTPADEGGDSGAVTEELIAIIDPTTGESGESIVSATVNEEALLAQMSPGGQNGTVVLRIDQPADVVKLQLAATAFAGMTAIDEAVMLRVETSAGALTIPSRIVAEALQKLGLAAEDAQITVAIAKADDGTIERIERFMSDIGAESVIEPVDFSITVTSKDGASVPISEFTSFVGRTLEWASESGNVSFNNLAGVAYDPQTNTFFPVPTVFASEDGTITATLYRQGFSYYSIMQNNAEFNDLPDSHYAKHEIETLANKWVVTGYDDGSFRAGESITRAQFAALLTRSLGMAPDKASAAAFSDVDPNAWYAGAVGAAVKNGLVKGYSDGLFKPNELVTRAEMAVMIANALKTAGYVAKSDGEQAVFQDAGQVKDWAKASVNLVTAEGIVKGTDDGRFAPNAAADRAQSAIMLYRMLKTLNFIN